MTDPTKSDNNPSTEDAAKPSASKDAVGSSPATSADDRVAAQSGGEKAAVPPVVIATTEPAGESDVHASQSRSVFETAGSTIDRVAKIIGTLAAVAGIFAAATWILEGEDREEERSLRQSALIEAAYRAIDDLQPGPERVLRWSPRLGWAIDTLTRYGEPVQLVADYIDFQGVKLSCGSFYLHARFGLLIQESSIENSVVLIDAINAAVHADIVGSRIEGPSSGIRRTDGSLYVGGRAEDSTIGIGGPTMLDIQAKNLTIDSGWPPVTFTGAPGRIISLEQDFANAIWPSEFVEHSTNDFPDVTAVPIFQGETYPIDEDPASQTRFVPYNRNSGVRRDSVRISAAFDTLCPSGSCPSAGIENPKLVREGSCKVRPETLPGFWRTIDRRGITAFQVAWGLGRNFGWAAPSAFTDGYGGTPMKDPIRFQ